MQIVFERFFSKLNFRSVALLTIWFAVVLTGRHATAREEAKITLLQNAALVGDVGNMKAAVDAGEDVNQPTVFGDTPLHFALRRTSLERRQGRVGAVNFLVSRGANVNSRNRRGVTPLMEAADIGDAEAVIYLVKHRATVDAADDEGRTALSLAASRLYSDIVTNLIENGASKERRDSQGRTPLMQAIAAVSISQPGSPAHAAEEKDRLSIVNLFLAQAAEVNGTDNKGWTPVALAVEKGSSAVVAALVRRGANVNARVPGIGNESPLMIAVRRNDPEILKLLLAAKPDLSIADARGRTALDYARWYHDDVAIELLRKSGAAR